MLNLEKVNIKELNTKLEQANAKYTYKIVLNNKSSAIILNASAVKLLKNSGLNSVKSYISSKNLAYNDMLNLLKNNSDIFTNITA